MLDRSLRLRAGGARMPISSVTAAVFAVLQAGVAATWVAMSLLAALPAATMSCGRMSSGAPGATVIDAR